MIWSHGKILGSLQYRKIVVCFMLGIILSCCDRLHSVYFQKRDRRSRCVSFTYLSVPVIFQHRDDTCGIHKHLWYKVLVCSCTTAKKKKKKVLIIAACCSLLNPTYTTLSFPCEELMSSGLWGARQKLSHCTHRHFCTHALVSLHTLTHTHPWLEFWHSQGLRPVDNEPEPIILSQWIERNRAKNESHRAN